MAKKKKPDEHVWIIEMSYSKGPWTPTHRCYNTQDAALEDAPKNGFLWRYRVTKYIPAPKQSTTRKKKG